MATLIAYAPSGPANTAAFNGVVAFVCVHGTSIPALFQTAADTSHVPLAGSIVAPLAVLPGSHVSVAASARTPSIAQTNRITQPRFTISHLPHKALRPRRAPNS